MLKKLEKASFEDCKKWSAEINGGEIPNTSDEFLKENDKVVSSIFEETSEVEIVETEKEFESSQQKIDSSNVIDMKTEDTETEEKFPVAA